MRDILFRGKTYSDKWVYGYLLKGSVDNDFYILENIGGTPFWIMPESIGQFTGSTDKNSKKIFEGDILEDILCGDKERYVVVFDEYLRYMITNRKSNYLLSQNNKDVEVIGNIHDNKELLGE